MRNKLAKKLRKVAYEAKMTISEYRKLKKSKQKKHLQDQTPKTTLQETFSKKIHKGEKYIDFKDRREKCNKNKRRRNGSR